MITQIYQTISGKNIRLKEITHLHLSNIIWINEIWQPEEKFKEERVDSPKYYLNERFKGEKLRYQPHISSLEEINRLRQDPDIEIIENKIFFKGEEISDMPF